MNKINIITPVTRVANLDAIYKSLQNQPIDIKWWVVFDPNAQYGIQHICENRLLSVSGLEVVCILSEKTNNVGGYSHRNVVLDKLNSEDWVFCLDDDTILHPNLLPYLKDMDLFSRFSGVIFAQSYKSGAIKLNVDENLIKVCHVDTGSIVFKMDIVGSKRFAEGHYVADGYFIEELYAQNKDKFTLRNVPLSYYNYIDEAPALPVCPVPCLQNTRELTDILKIYSDIQPKKAMEIGSFFGGTLFYWLKYAPTLTKFISLDYPIPSSDGRYLQMLESKVKWFDWLKSAPNMVFSYFPNDSTSPATVSNVSAHVPDADLDFLFIDGGHHYDIVKSDYEKYAPLVRKGGVVAFHDIYGIEDVNRYWNEIKEGKNFLEIHDVENNGDGIGVLFV